MGSSPDQMQFFSVLLKLMGARSTIEVGVFTGYSLLSTALALPAGGKVVAIDVSRECYELGRPVIEAAGVAHKVDFREGDGLAVLDGMLCEDGGARAGAFDFAYADADKLQYAGYHERLLRLVRVGGVIAYDNTLWGGSVAMPRDMPGSSDYDRLVRDSFLRFNAAVAADDRVEACILPIADGVTLCRRRHALPPRQVKHPPFPLLIAQHDEDEFLVLDPDIHHTCGIIGIRPYIVCGMSRGQPTRAVCGRIVELPTRVVTAASCHTPNKYY
uniref:Caffeoyl-CoA O-methyltransferase n=2 Tax=Aegilops tauschii TaxID=37682 RepID=A0A453J9U8_AEGTS